MGVDKAYYTEKCSGVESASLNAANPTSRVHAVVGGGLEKFLDLRNCIPLILALTGFSNERLLVILPT